MKRNGSRSCVTRKSRFGSRERDWLKGDTQRGCVCLYRGTAEPPPPSSGPQASSNPQTDLQLVLCSTSTTVEELCAQRDGQELYIQLHGDLVRWILCDEMKENSFWQQPESSCCLQTAAFLSKQTGSAALLHWNCLAYIALHVQAFTRLQIN